MILNTGKQWRSFRSNQKVNVIDINFVVVIFSKLIKTLQTDKFRRRSSFIPLDLAKLISTLCVYLRTACS